MGDGGTGGLKGDVNALTTLAGAIVDFLLIFDGVMTTLDGVFSLFNGDDFFGVLNPENLVPASERKKKLWIF